MGYPPAMAASDKYHGVAKFNVATGKQHKGVRGRIRLKSQSDLEPEPESNSTCCAKQSCGGGGGVGVDLSSGSRYDF